MNDFFNLQLIEGSDTQNFYSIYKLRLQDRHPNLINEGAGSSQMPGQRNLGLRSKIIWSFSRVSTYNAS